MRVLLPILLLSLSCQSVEWLEVRSDEPQASEAGSQGSGSEGLGSEGLGGEDLPSSVLARGQDGKPLEGLAAEGSERGEVAIYILTGWRRIQSSVFDQQQDMRATGPELSWIPKGWPIGLEIGTQWAENKTTAVVGTLPSTIKGIMAEVYAGPRLQTQLFSLGGFPISSYIGGGATAMIVNIERERNGLLQEDRDFGTGWYAHTGLLIPGAENMVIGFDFRWVGGSTLDLFGEKSSADGYQLSLQFAIQF